MSYNEIQHGYPLGPGSPYYTYEFKCGCGWEYDTLDGESESNICPECGAVLRYR